MIDGQLLRLQPVPFDVQPRPALYVLQVHVPHGPDLYFSLRVIGKPYVTLQFLLGGVMRGIRELVRPVVFQPVRVGNVMAQDLAEDAGEHVRRVLRRANAAGIL